MTCSSYKAFGLIELRMFEQPQRPGPIDTSAQKPLFEVPATRRVVGGSEPLHVVQERLREGNEKISILAASITTRPVSEGETPLTLF